MFDEAPVTILSGELRLEGRLHERLSASLAAVVAHPHPQYGGDMDNHVVATMCGVLGDSGATTLRFNFRGTGRSEGACDGGRGESDDVRAAATDLRARVDPEVPLVLVGYSFGAAMAVAAAGDVRAHGLICVSLPVPAPPVPDGVATLIVTGDRDPIAPATQLRALACPGVEVEVIEGVDHSWYPGLDRLGRAVQAFVGKVQLAHKPR